MSATEIRNLLNLLESITLMELTDKVKNQQFDRLQSENPNFDPDEIKKYIDAWDAFVQGFPNDKKDITVLSLEEIVRLIRDASFKRNLKGRDTPFHKKPEINRDMDAIYNKNGLEILKGDMKEKCIKYGENSSWCISRNDAKNMYYEYRTGLEEPVFYFVFDTDRPETDPLHRFVIHADRDGNYALTDFDNKLDKEMSWNEIEQIQPKLRGLQKLFVHIPLSDKERTDYEKYSTKVDTDTYISFSLEEKYKYIKFGNELNPEQQDATPKDFISIYAIQNPSAITKETWNRLKSGDKRKIIYNVISLDENNYISPYYFSRNVLEEPWHMTGLSKEIIVQAEAKITLGVNASKYAHFILEKTSDPSQVPDIILIGVVNTGVDASYHYAKHIIEVTGNDSKVPDIIVKKINRNHFYQEKYDELIYGNSEDDDYYY